MYTCVSFYMHTVTSNPISSPTKVEQKVLPTLSITTPLNGCRMTWREVFISGDTCLMHHCLRCSKDGTQTSLITFNNLLALQPRSLVTLVPTFRLCTSLSSQINAGLVRPYPLGFFTSCTYLPSAMEDDSFTQFDDSPSKNVFYYP